MAPCPPPNGERSSSSPAPQRDRRIDAFTNRRIAVSAAKPRHASSIRQSVNSPIGQFVISPKESPPMARIHLHGLVIAHAQGKQIRGLMLDSNQIPIPLPVHYQSLVLPTKSIVDDQLRLPKVDIRERWRPDLPPPLNDTEVTAWDLSGCRIKVSSSIEGQLKRYDTWGFHPDPDDPNWTPLHWVADARRLFPGATLKKDYREARGDGVPGKLSALVDFAGGTLSGDRPVAVNGPDWVFFMAPDFVQAITDCMMCDAPNDLPVATLQA